MGDISQFKDRKTDNLYNVKDVQARTEIQNIKEKIYEPSQYSGLGRKLTVKNIVNNENVLTVDMLSIANTEYYIQYDYDLKGESITLPANVSLIFIGGSISNGTLAGNNTRIEAKKGVQIFDNITIQGTWEVEVAYSSWFKMFKQGYKISSVTEGGATLYKGTDNNYYAFDDLTLLGSNYYVTSTLEEGEIVAGSIKVTATNYDTFRIVGDDTNYIAAPLTIPGTFDASSYAQYDDSAALQSLLDLRASKTIIEDGVYIIKGDRTYFNNRYAGLYVDGHKNSELVIEGWLKVLPNNRGLFNAIDIIGCENLRVSGNGGIQGDLLEHINTGGEGGMNIAIANSKYLIVENITSAYAWGDCIYSHWWTNGRPSMNVGGNSLQKFHTFKNVSIIYGGRTGYACELADNVVFDGCYFYGSGRVRGKATNSAIDIEPFNYSDTPQRYVMNYEFKNNIFKNCANGIRLERCVNCSVHDNFFDYGWAGISIIWHKDVSYDITSASDRGWLKSRMNIYNNNIKRAGTGISLGYTNCDCENVEIDGNTLVSCTTPMITTSNITIRNCKIHDNITYGCGQWSLGKMVDCDIFNNKNYACKMSDVTTTWGAGNIINIQSGAYEGSKGSKVHHNSFSLDYGKSFYGLGEDGKEEIYHGLPVGFRYTLCSNVILNQPEKIHFYENQLSDDFIVNYGASGVAHSYENNAYFGGGMNTIRTETSEVFLTGDTFHSTTYGDEGKVTRGGMAASSMLENVRDFESNLEVFYGEIIKVGSYYKLCNRSGVCGESLSSDQGECGTARFTTKGIYPADSLSANNIKIVFTTVGICTSSTRPETFLYEGRRMHETDTGKDIRWDGTEWVDLTGTTV